MRRWLEPELKPLPTALTVRITRQRSSDVWATGASAAGQPFVYHAYASRGSGSLSAGVTTKSASDCFSPFSQ